MEYSKIVAITGLPGLFELISSKTDGAIVRSLEDKSTRFVSSRVHHFSHLESIEVYTIRENVNLVDIFHAMQKDGGKLPDEKDPAAVKAYFKKAFADLDFDRVYNSDMRKMVKWFAILDENKVEIKLSEPEAEEEEVVAEEAAPAAPVAEEKPAKKTTKKKAVAEDAPAAEEKPAKKTAAKAAPKTKK